MPPRRRSPGITPSMPYNPPARRESGGWEITLCGDLSDRQGDLLARIAELPRRSRGLIYFDSSGGSVYTGLGLATMIRLRGLRATGVVAGECSSAALLPFAACEERLVTAHSTLLFHPVRWQSEEDVRYEEAVEWARHFKLLEEDLDKLLSKMFPYPMDKLQEWTRPGRFVSGAEVVEAGLARMLDLFAGDLWGQIPQKNDQ
jgi:ATP-dependent protease ClpP protease subunit